MAVEVVVTWRDWAFRMIPGKCGYFEKVGSISPSANFATSTALRQMLNNYNNIHELPSL